MLTKHVSYDKDECTLTARPVQNIIQLIQRRASTNGFGTNRANSNFDFRVKN
jgi:hypothetical protein